MKKGDFVGYDVLVTFLDGLFAPKWFWDLRFKVFEAGELAVYCDECCFSEMFSKRKREFTRLQIQSQEAWFRTHRPR